MNWDKIKAHAKWALNDHTREQNVLFTGIDRADADAVARIWDLLLEEGANNECRGRAPCPHCARWWRIFLDFVDSQNA